MNKFAILALIVMVAGTFGGVVRFYNTMDTSKEFNWNEFVKFLLTGIGAAILVPLFLNMISSDLIKPDPVPALNYFLFTGFCFIAGYLSDKFLAGIGDRVLGMLKEEVKAVKNKQEKNSRSLNMLVDTFGERDMPEADQKLQLTRVTQNLKAKLGNQGQEQLLSILHQFEKDEKIKFRTAAGIAKDLHIPQVQVESMLEHLEEERVVALILEKEDGYSYWGITEKGRDLKKNLD